MDLSNLDQVKEQVGKLIEYELYESAENILQLVLSRNKPDVKSKLMQATCYELIGDICYKRQEFKRAISQYSQALQQFRFSKKTPASSSSSVNAIRTPEEAELKHKCSKCNLALGDNSAALKDLEVIPNPLRTVPINLTFCKIYKKGQLKSPEATALKTVLKDLPIAIELINELLNLEEPIEKIREVTKPLPGSWLDDLIGVFGLKKKCEYGKALQHTKKMMLDFPQCPYTLSLSGNISLDSGDYRAAKSQFLSIKRSDPLITTDMEKLGYAFFNLGEAAELNKLANDTLQASESRPEGWLVAGLSCHKQSSFNPNDTTMSENALTFYEKAKQMDPSRSFTYYLIGQFLLDSDQASKANVAFSQANLIDKSVHSFIGYITGHLALNKSSSLKSAVDLAREAMIAYPHNAAVLTIFATVLTKIPNKDAECIQVLKKALSIDPVSIDAICILSARLVLAKKKDEAIQVLQSSLSRINHYRLHNQYASLLITEARYTEAMEHLHISLGQQPADNEVALREIESLDALLKENTFKNSDSFSSNLDDNDLIDMCDDKHQFGMSNESGLSDDNDGGNGSDDDFGGRAISGISGFSGGSSLHHSHSMMRRGGERETIDSRDFTGSSAGGIASSSRLRSHFMPESEGDGRDSGDEYIRSMGQHRHHFEEFSGDDDVIAIDRALFRD